MEKVKYPLREYLLSGIARTEIRVRQLIRTPSKAIILVVSCYLALVITAEIVAASGRVLAGAFLDGAILVILVNLYYFIRKPEIRRFILALGLVPLMRILSVAIPVPQIPLIFWYALIGFPLLVAALIVVRKNGLPQLTQNLSTSQWFIQSLFGLTGIPLGFLAGQILTRPAPILPATTLGWIIMGSIVLSLSSGFAEEIIFRGLVQNSIIEIYGSIGLFVMGIFYTGMLLGALDPRYIIFFGLTGLLFSLWVKVSHSLWGVILAHSLLNIIFLLLLAR